VAGRVQVAESTRRLLGDPFVLEEGAMQTWFVGGRTTTQGGHQSWQHAQIAS